MQGCDIQIVSFNQTRYFVCPATGLLIKHRYFLVLDGEKYGCFITLPVAMRWLHNQNMPELFDRCIKETEEYFKQPCIPLQPFLPALPLKYSVSKFLNELSQGESWLLVEGSESVKEFEKSQHPLCTKVLTEQLLGGKRMRIPDGVFLSLASDVEGNLRELTSMLQLLSKMKHLSRQGELITKTPHQGALVLGTLNGKRNHFASNFGLSGDVIILASKKLKLDIRDNVNDSPKSKKEFADEAFRVLFG